MVPKATDLGFRLQLLHARQHLCINDLRIQKDVVERFLAVETVWKVLLEAFIDILCKSYGLTVEVLEAANVSMELGRSYKPPKAPLYRQSTQSSRHSLLTQHVPPWPKLADNKAAPDDQLDIAAL